MNEQHQSYCKATQIYKALAFIIKSDGHVSYPIIINGNSGSDTPYINITVAYNNEELLPCLKRIIDFHENDIEVELKYRQKPPGQ